MPITKMAQSQATFFFLSLVIHCILAAGAPLRTRAVMAPIKLDQRTSLYTFSANDGSSFVIDLCSQVLSVKCPRNHLTFPCNSPQCSALTGPFTPSCQPPHFTRCSSGSCSIPLQNPINNECASAELSQTTLNLNTTNGKNPTGPISIPHLLSACVPPTFLVSLPYHAQGLAPFGPTKFSLPSLFASAAPRIKKKFALCLPSSEIAPGVLFLGEGPFFLLPPWFNAVTSRLVYTQLVRHLEHPPAYYLVPLNGIAVGEKGIGAPVRGGIARLSTSVLYSTLSTPIYKAFTNAFNEATSGIPRVKAVEPFEICLNQTNLGSTRVGYPLNPVDLMMDGTNWTIEGFNLMKEIDRSRICLAFLDGGHNPQYEVVIGSFQMQNNFLLFDLENWRLGFSGILLGSQTTCQNFNFTSSMA